MPTTNPEKNREYVKASNMKKKEQIGVEEYNKYFAGNQQQYRDRKKETEEKAELYKKQQAEYMKQYRAKKRQEKGAISSIGDYVKASKARRDYINELSAQVPVKRRGRPLGSKNKSK